jgi:hypothetical protein
MAFLIWILTAWGLILVIGAAIWGVAALAARGRSRKALYLVTIEGDPDRAAGLLAAAGIQDTDYRETSVTARLHAADAAKALQRVQHALGRGSFTIGPARQELPPPA